MYRILKRPACAAALALAVVTLAVTACSDSSTAPSAAILPGAPYSQTDLVVGTGDAAVAGRVVTVNYTGWLYDPAQPQNKGRQFDTSVGAAPFMFQLGTGQVIPGWDRGVAGMRVGGSRRLVIPPDLAYGAQGAGNGIIPPNATLVFDITLVGVQ